MLRGFRRTFGVALTVGVGVLDATAAFEVYGQSAAARALVVAAGDSVRTRHGLILLTTSTHDATDLSRLVVPGASERAGVDPRLRRWADSRRLTVEPLGDGFTAALQDLADHTDAATARATAKMIGYPTTDLDLHGGHRSWRTVLLALAGLALAVLIGRTPASLARRRRRRSLTPGSAPATGPATGPTAEPDDAVNASA